MLKNYVIKISNPTTMNNLRRKTLANICNQLDLLKEELQLDVIDSEQEAFNNIPESLQESERGQKMEEIISYLEYAFCELQSAIDNINSVLDC